MNLRLACADFTFPLLDHDQVLDLVKLLGFDGIDIGLFEGRSHLWPSKEFISTTASARELAKKLKDRDLEPADVFLQTAPDFISLAPNHPEISQRRKARDMFERTLEYAAACGSHHVSALPGVNFDTQASFDSWNCCCEELAWRCERAQSAKLIFGIEAHIGSIAPTPTKALELVNAVPGLTLTLDYTHFIRDGFSDEDVEPLVAHATHFHVRGAQKDRLQCSFKNNAIDYGRVLEAMRATDYEGYLGVEYVWVDWEHCNEVDNLSETILFRDLLRASMQRN